MSVHLPACVTCIAHWRTCTFAKLTMSNLPHASHFTSGACRARPPLGAATMAAALSTLAFLQVVLVQLFNRSGGAH